MKKTILLLFLLGQTLLTFAQKAQAPDPQLQKLKANLATAKHDTTRMMVYVDISSYFDTEEQFDSSLAYALKAGQLAKQYPKYPYIAKVWFNIGNSYSTYFDLLTNNEKKKYYESLAKYYFKQAIADAKRLGNEEYFMKASFNLNNQYAQTNESYLYHKSVFELLNHIERKNKLNALDSLVLRKTYKRLCAKVDYDIDSKWWAKYLMNAKKYIKKQDNDYEYTCLLEFEQNTALGKRADEEKILKKYHHLKNELKTHSLNNELNFYLASFYFNIGEYKKSLQISHQYAPNKEIDKTDQLSLLTIYLMNTGKCEYELGRNKEAIQHLTKAFNSANQILSTKGLEYEKYTTLLYLSKAYKKAENYQQALACNEQADALYKEMHDVTKQALMAENDVYLEELKQEKKVQAARTQTLLKEQEIEIQKKQKYAFLAISIFALLSAAWAVFSFIKTRKQNQVISQQATALEESNHLKDKIFALLSHDLRSPINRLVSGLNQSIESQRTHIQVEIKGVQDILNNVLYWANMQLKKATPVYTHIPLQPLADALIDEYQYALEEKSITFLNTIDKDCILKTDEGYLKIVLRNLISNAIKFTPNKGYIQIDCKIKENIAQIRLRDTGIGIAAQKIDSLFQLPMPSIGTNQEKGTGLGLSLSLDIVKKLGGSLNIQSQEGKGTQVVMSLPIAA